jgi:hypothetical protein
MPLLERQSVPTDIRWANDDSVYVSWDRDGVLEVGLDGARRRELVPNLKELGGLQHYSQLAVSPTSLAVASKNWTFAWRSLLAKANGEVVFAKRKIPVTNDFDLQGDRVLLMGISKPVLPPGVRDGWLNAYSAQLRGAVAWVGTLSAQFQDFQPVLFDVGGAGAPNYLHCYAEDIGAVRFLADGSFVIVPGFQDGVNLYDPSGKLVRSWTNAQVGLDTHLTCALMTDEEKVKLGGEAYWGHWLNSHHLVDDILPLPQGPGLLVRSWGPDDQAHWTLKVLLPEGIETYQVPIVGRRPPDRLRGDVRNGKVVLLLSASGFPWSREPDNYPAEVFVAEIPNR